MTSESTRFLGQPRERKPTVGVVFGAASSVAAVDSLFTYLLYRGIDFSACLRGK